MKESLLLLKDFMEPLKSTIYKYMTSISKHVCIGKIDDIVNKYNNTHHSTIKRKPVDIKSHISKHIYRL